MGIETRDEAGRVAYRLHETPYPTTVYTIAEFSSRSTATRPV